VSRTRSCASAAAIGVVLLGLQAKKTWIAVAW
jgi:hypothetical protein